MARPKGTGTVVKMRGKFYARWRKDGKNVYAGPFDTYNEADKARLTAPKPQTKKSSSPSFGEWCHEQMLGTYGQSLADSTFDTNETIRLKHVEGTELEKVKLYRLDRNLLSQWLANRPGSASWKNRMAAFVSKMLALAVIDGHIPSNPMRQVKLPAIEERSNATLDPDAASKLLNPESRIGAIVILALTTGARRSEILRLKWSHVKKSSILLPGTKSRRARREVPLIPEAKAAIDAQPRRSEYVFTTSSGLPLSPRNVTRDVKALLPEGTRLHDLRGTYVSLLFESGADLRMVMELAGHGDPRTTLKMYARSRMPAKQAIVEGMVKGLKERVDESA